MCMKKIEKAYCILGLLNRNFKDMLIKAFVQLYKTLVRPHVEYANAVWAPHHKMLIEEIEKVQMRATKLIKKYRKCTYEETLRQLELPTLRYCRLRGDMIEVFKLVHGIYDSSAIALEFSHNIYTRGNRFKLLKKQVHYDACKYFL